MKSPFKIAALALLLGAPLSASASLLNVWGSDWNQMTVTAGNGDGVIAPGVGGQPFDVEFLMYKFDASSNTLHVGLQTGFDIIDADNNGYRYGNKDYFNGDLALSFDGDDSQYEYALDFGNLTKGYYGTNLGTDAAGLYAVTSWSNDVYTGHGVSNPFAMASGNLLIAANGSNFTESYAMGADGKKSFYNMFSFNIGAIGLMSDFTMDAHWTMSCGNDWLDARADIKVPEPAPFALLGLGLLGLAAMRKRKA
ncbi:PEP-CTERM sorting domain-containing protein [Simiduia sp. 21SJ11W-1]|uniref:PEP-CTERM sorting domain-containing protein n=1 Tax=Simiduia sp. 21SJ11W-1 TaxID=2909669 RepID=UPI00209CF0D0|nr:PEP-CTERM sorting domain-containing protein [Simiduia sp. 21SJ11W-1]UTA48534.1 PEP-CTERM sorting domain-containing protein [Simiduia sp. 21SJ11W-1]